MKEKFVIGVDFGTDSVRVLLVNALTGEHIKDTESKYTRWAKGAFCDPSQDIFRQHPLDYIESFEEAIIDLTSSLSATEIKRIEGLSICSTGSTVAAVDKAGVPLAFREEFSDNPNAMFLLWKDHSAEKEAQEINSLAKEWPVDFLKFSGGIYSAEWFWSKILHVCRNDRHVDLMAYSWLEHCDWFTALLCGITDVSEIKVSRCAAGHKALWHSQFGGLPEADFLSQLDSRLAEFRQRMYLRTYTSDQVAGTLSSEWTTRLGLCGQVKVGVGLLDAHAGAVGSGICKPTSLIKVLGTSTCDLMNLPADSNQERVIKGICGQVDGSIIPGHIGLEAGQSAFGDLFGWYKELLLTPFRDFAKGEYMNEMEDWILPWLSDRAARMPVYDTDLVSVDWLNGRRTPDVDMSLKAGIIGLSLASQPAHIFKSLVESAAFGSRAILDRLTDQGISVSEIIALGGIAQKSPYVMQTLSDVMNLEIRVVKSSQACALGAAMLAATACGVYQTVPQAQQAMSSGFGQTYQPDSIRHQIYTRLYKRYKALGSFIENHK